MPNQKDRTAVIKDLVTAWKRYRELLVPYGSARKVLPALRTVDRLIRGLDECRPLVTNPLHTPESLIAEITGALESGDPIWARNALRHCLQTLPSLEPKMIKSQVVKIPKVEGNGTGR